jgi:hypothetical protein
MLGALYTALTCCSCTLAQVLQEQLGRRVTGMDALRPMLARSLADLQERLIYRCQAYIKDNVASYAPSAEDVDFPAKLEKLAEAEKQDAAAVAAAAAAAEAGSSEIQEEGAEGQGAAAPAAQADPYSVWYLPLRSTLLVLSKLYRAVDGKIFSGGLGGGGQGARGWLTQWLDVDPCACWACYSTCLHS